MGSPGGTGLGDYGFSSKPDAVDKNGNPTKGALLRQAYIDFQPCVLGKIFFFGILTLFKIICPVGLIFKLVLFFIVEVDKPSVFFGIKKRVS